MRAFKKNHAYTKSPNNPAPSVLSELKWLAPNIQVPKSMSLYWSVCSNDTFFLPATLCIIFVDGVEKVGFPL